MIQVYKKNELFIIENTVTDIIYPNLTREEAIVLLKKFDRNEPEHRCDFAIKEDNISFEYASLDDKDKTIADLEAKLAESNEQLEMAWDDFHRMQNEKIKVQHQLAEKNANLHQIYSHLGVEAFGEDIHEQALKEIESKSGTIKALQNGLCVDLLNKEMLELRNQDKISFAVEQLEKVSQDFSMRVGITDSNMDLLNEIIDNQIEELKKEMK